LKDIRKKSQPPGAIDAAGRTVGFGLFAALGIAIFACVVLVPEYVALIEARYERDRLAADVADLAALAATKERLISDMSNDRVCTMRLLAAYEGLAPADHVVLIDPESEPTSPLETITFRRHERPDPPNGGLLRAARRLERPPLRRGLCVLAAMSLGLAFFAFSPARRKPRAR
jgi:hypothetical protein